MMPGQANQSAPQRDGQPVSVRARLCRAGRRRRPRRAVGHAVRAPGPGPYPGGQTRSILKS